MAGRKVHKDFNGSTLEDIGAESLFAPQEYQRDLFDKWVDKVATGWDAHLFRYPTVSLRADGRYAILDGQHTVAAASDRGHSTIPCLVLRGLSLAEEAAIFSDLNTQRRKPEAYDVYVADLAAGREWALTLKAIATKHELQLAKGGVGPNILRAVGAMREVIKKGNADVADAALGVLVNAYDASEPNNAARVERAMVLGMIDLIIRARSFGAFDEASFTRRLARATYRTAGATQPVTPKGFQSYLNALIGSGDLVIPALNSGAGQGPIYGKALALAILGREQARKIYAM